MATSTPATTGPAPVPLILSESHSKSLEPYLPPPAGTPSAVHVTLTYASSLDSSISLSPGVQTLLSGAESKAMTHFLRSRHDAILVGVNTAEADDPGLNCRIAHNEDPTKAVGLDQQPVPIILDPSGRWSCKEDARVLRLARERTGKPPLWVVDAERKISDDKLAIIKAAGGGVIFHNPLEKSNESSGKRIGVNWGQILQELWTKGCKSLMVEGGATVIGDLLRKSNQELVNTVVVTIAPVWLGKGGVVVSPDRHNEGLEAGRLKDVKWLPMGEDVVMAGRFN